MCNARVIISNCLWLVLTAAGFEVAAETMNFSQAYQEHLQVMTSVVDEFFDPCEDFFQHACGNYDSQAAPLAPFLYNQEATVQFFETSRRNFSTRGGTLLNDLYESCKQRKRDVSQWKHVGFLAQFSRWPYLRYQWDEANIQASWPRLAAQLAARGVPVFFDTFFAKNTIYMSPAHITCPTSQAAVKATIMSPATSVVSEQVGDIISSELLFFCRELTGEWVSSVEVPEATGDTDETLEFFNELFEVLGFTLEEIEQSRKIPIKTDKLEKILAVVRRTETRQVVNFLIWKMTQALDYDDCFRLSDEFEPLLLSEYWNWGVFKPKIAKDVAFASFLYHTTRYQKRRKDRLASEDWTAFLDKKVVRKKDFNIDRVIKAYAKRNLSPQAIADDYAGLVTLAETFHKNYFDMKSRQLRLSFVHDNFVDNDDTNHPSYLLKKFLNFAIITKRLPLYHYFSTEGFELWRNSGLFSSTDDLYAAIDCLSRQTELYLGEYPTFSSLSVEQMDEVLKFYRAFHESFYDYLFWLEGEEFASTEDYELQQFGLTSSRVMFYSVAQLYCGRDDARYATLINRSFMNSMEFQDAFECEIEAPMNPTAKCMCKDC